MADVTISSDSVAVAAHRPLPLAEETTRGWQLEEEGIRALYRLLLLREPDPKGLAAHAQLLRQGRPFEQIMRSFLRSREFAQKRSSFLNTYFQSTSVQNPCVSDIAHRCPEDLTITPLSFRRVAVIGQCLLVDWPKVIERIMPGCQCDFLLFNRVQELPEQPPAQPSEYDFQLVNVPLRSVLPDRAYFRLSYGEPEAYKALFQECRDRLRAFLQAAMRWNRAYGLLTFVTNFMLPQQNPMGRLLPRHDLRNLVYFVERLNEVLAEELGGYNNAFLFDLDQIIATFGRKYCQDDVIWVSNHNGVLSDHDFQYDQDRLEEPVPASHVYEPKVQLFYELGWKELLAMYRTIKQIDMVKLVVLDIDDTLWRGVAAECTEHSSETIEGWPIGLVEALGHLKRRGMLLAIMSKNEEKLIRPIWQRLFEGRLSLDDFAIRKINWKPKTENFAEILGEANLLARSVVYIDDNPVERAAVKAAFPDVRTFGPNPLLWRRILLWSAETQVATITKESALRTDMVRAQVERESQRKQLSRQDFLASLQVEVALRELDNVELPAFARALELINKSNQFNTTGKRWTKQEFHTEFANNIRLFLFDVKDRFTSYGIVGVVIVEKTRIRQFVMSCRVVGMEVEIAAVTELLRILRESCGKLPITADLKETELNLLARDLWQRCGFTEGAGGWSHCRSSAICPPAHVKMTVVSAPDRVPVLAS